MKAWYVRIMLIVVGLSLTMTTIVLSFDGFLVVSTTGLSAIWGPPIGRAAVAIGAGLLVGGAAWARGPVRLLVVAVWLIFLALTTHRLVEESDGRVADIWLTVPVQTLVEDPGRAADATMCRVETWIARCATASGRTLVSVTPLPFVRLFPGALDCAGT